MTKDRILNSLIVIGLVVLFFMLIKMFLYNKAEPDITIEKIKWEDAKSYLDLKIKDLLQAIKNEENELPEKRNTLQVIEKKVVEAQNRLNKLFDDLMNAQKDFEKIIAQIKVAITQLSSAASEFKSIAKNYEDDSGRFSGLLTANQTLLDSIKFVMDATSSLETVIAEEERKPFKIKIDSVECFNKKHEKVIWCEQVNYFTVKISLEGCLHNNSEVLAAKLWANNSESLIAIAIDGNKDDLEAKFTVTSKKNILETIHVNKISTDRFSSLEIYCSSKPDIDHVSYDLKKVCRDK